MSTKTNFKRIALVAVAALGMGLLSSAPSQATIEGTPTVTVVNGTAGVSGQASDSNTAATIAVRYFAATTADTATVTVTLGTRPAGATSVTLNGASLLVTALDTATSTGLTTTTPVALVTGIDSQVASTLPTIAAGANSFAGAKFGVHLDSSVATRVAGTYTMNYVVRFFANGTADATKTATGTFNIVVSDGTAAAAGTAASAGTSTAVMTKQGVGEGTDESDLRAVMTADGAAVANIVVTLKSAAGLTTQESVTVSTTKGFIGTAATLAGGTSAKSITLVGAANGVNTLYLIADGTSGTATISVKSTSVTFTNKSAVFYGTTVAKIVATKRGNTLGGSAANVISAIATDADGNQITSNSSVYAYSSALTVVNTGATTGTECTYSSTSKAHICSLAGSNDGTANITLRNKSTAALSTVASDAISVVVNTKSPVALKLAFNKATYAPGEVAYVQLWAVDASGAPVAPGVARTNLLSAAGITTTAAFGAGTALDSLTVNSISPTLGFTSASSRGFASLEPIYLATVYMPVTGGAVTISATGGSLLPATGQVAVTATATVTDNAAAALAAVTALATTVASLKTLITTLTNLVLKIQKKVKA